MPPRGEGRRLLGFLWLPAVRAVIFERAQRTVRLALENDRLAPVHSRNPRMPGFVAPRGGIPGILQEHGCVLPACVIT